MRVTSDKISTNRFLLDQKNRIPQLILLIIFTYIYKYDILQFDFLPLKYC